MINYGIVSRNNSLAFDSKLGLKVLRGTRKPSVVSPTLSCDYFDVVDFASFITQFCFNFTWQNNISQESKAGAGIESSVSKNLGKEE